MSILLNFTNITKENSFLVINRKELCVIILFLIIVEKGITEVGVDI